MAGPILYVAEVDYGAEHHAVFEAWYANRHAPDLFRLGSRTVSSYRPVIGGLAVLNVYELPDSDLLKTPAYPAITAKDPYGPDVRATSAGKKRGQALYLQRTVTPVPPDDANPRVDADWISLLRFAVPEAQDAALIAWVSNDLQKSLAGFGAKRLRYGTRIADKVGAGSDRPRCMLFAEWPARPPAAADLLPPLQKRFGAALADAEPFVGSRAYPWPDRKSGTGSD
jgi:hypothetical protein